MEYTIILDEAKLNVIGAGLAELPFKLSAPVLDDIREQVRKQTQPDPATSPVITP